MFIRQTKKTQGKILVVGGGPTTFLSIIRSFGRKGFEVHVANDSATDLALYSRYITRAHRIAPSSAAARRKSDIIRIMKKEKFDLVIPVGDQNVIPFHQFRHEYEAAGRVYLIDDNAFRITNSKILTGQFARDLGIPVPRSEIISDVAGSSSVLSTFTFPVMLKPASSFTLENLEEKSEVKKTDTKKQAEQSLRGMLLHGEVLVQEYFEGTGIGLEVLACEGKILVSFQHIRVHEEGKSIGSTYRKSQPVDETFLSGAGKMVAALHYTGVAMFEFRQNTDTKKWVLIEINGRFWGSLPLPLACGVDFPFFLYQVLIEGRREFPRTYRTGLYCRNTSADLQWLGTKIFHRDSLQRTKGYPVFRYILEWGNILFLREKNDVLVLDDLTPGMMEIYRLFKKGCFWAIRRVRKKYAYPRYSPKKHRTDLPEALRNAHSILFVCFGNICRSPFAEAALRTMVSSEIQVGSCGFYPVADRSCPVEAVSSARNYDIDLSGHRSRVITEEMIRNSDVIFIFDGKNLQSMAGKYPRIMDKVWYFSEVMQKGPVAIQDPYGEDLAVFEQVYRDIFENCEVIASRLT